MHARAATADDYDAFCRFSLQLQDQPPASRELWTAHICPATIFLVAETGELAAYNCSYVFGARGDVRQVVVDREFRGRGVGKVLMAAVAARLRAAGCTEWRLEVRADNAPALALYRSVGMRLHHTIDNVRMTAADCARFVAATRASAGAVGEPATVIDPADDAELERVHDFGAGQLARWRRARGHAPLVRVGTIGLAQLWYDFAADRGLLFPFRAATTDVAADLIAAALTTVPARDDYEISLIDPAICAALLAAGARHDETQLELAGSL